MSNKLIVPTKPCESCPYRKDVPRGIWDKSEYEKLRDYDDGPQGQQSFSAFLCHHSPQIGQDAVCRGWLSVHSESVAVRLMIIKGTVTPEQVYAETPCELYASGNEAADAGIKGIKRPSIKAREAIGKLTKAKASRSRLFTKKGKVGTMRQKAKRAQA